VHRQYHLFQSLVTSGCGLSDDSTYSSQNSLHCTQCMKHQVKCIIITLINWGCGPVLKLRPIRSTYPTKPGSPSLAPFAVAGPLLPATVGGSEEVEVVNSEQSNTCIIISNDLQMTSSVYMAAHTCHCGRNFTFIIHLTVLV